MIFYMYYIYIYDYISYNPDIPLLVFIQEN